MKIEEIIRNDEENQICLDEISRLMDLDAEVDSKDGILLGVLSLVVHEYEVKHYPLDKKEKQKMKVNSYLTCKDCGNDQTCDIQDFIFRSPEYNSLDDFGCIHFE